MSEHHRLKIIIREIIENAWPAVLTTVGQDGRPFTRAMNNLHHKNEVNFAQSAFFEKQGEWTFLFRTHKSSAKVHQILESNKANVFYTQSREMTGLTLLGTIRELDDPRIKEMLWKNEWENFFLYGMEDPEYTLLKFEAAEFRLFAPIADQFQRINGTIKDLK